MIFNILLSRSVQTPNSDKNWQTSRPLQTSLCNISRHMEFIIEQGHRVNWVSGSLDCRVTGSLGHQMWPSSMSAGEWWSILIAKFHYTGPTGPDQTKSADLVGDPGRRPGSRETVRAGPVGSDRARVVEFSLYAASLLAIRHAGVGDSTRSNDTCHQQLVLQRLFSVLGQSQRQLQTRYHFHQRPARIIAKLHIHTYWQLHTIHWTGFCFSSSPSSSASSSMFCACHLLLHVFLFFWHFFLSV